MEVTVELLKFGVINLNDRIYTEDSFEGIDLNVDFYGQIGQEREFNLSNSTHRVKDIRISSDGCSLLGTVEIFTNSFSEILKDNIEEYVFRPRILGVIEDGIVKVQDIISFDAVPCVSDSWYGMDIDVDESDFESVSLITNNFKEHLSESDNVSILSEYMNYHLKRMNPSYYESYEERIEEMIHHKEVYDNSMLCMISNDIDPNKLISLIQGMITHYENNENYENCSFLNNYLNDFIKEIDYND